MSHRAPGGRTQDLLSTQVKDIEIQGKKRAGGALATPPATSLVLMDQTVDEIVDEDDPMRLCPRIDHRRQYWVNTWTGERRADSCRANACEVCIVSNARRKARILSWAEPQRYAVLTQYPDDWQVGRQKMRDLVRFFKRRGYVWN